MPRLKIALIAETWSEIYSCVL